MGVGWPINTDSKKVEWKEYYEKAKKKYKVDGSDKGWWRALNALKNRVKADDLCWTRDLNGIYYLGRVQDDSWFYSTYQLNIKADIVNYRKCHWMKVGEIDSVPGQIVNRFIRGGTLERIKGATMREFSKFLYNYLSDSEEYQIKQVEPDFFSLIHSDDCEDIIGLFLQAKGYHIIPSSCKKSTVNYEFVLKHKEDGHKSVVQVKKGHVDLNIGDYGALNSKVYLFTTDGSYTGNPTSNVAVIDKKEVQSFVNDNFNVLPDKIQTWIKIYNHLQGNKFNLNH